MECFVYNRTPAYDAIVKRMKKHEKDEASNASMESLAKQKSNMTTGTDGSGLGFGARLRKVVKSTISESGHHQDSSSTAGKLLAAVYEDLTDHQVLRRSLRWQTRTQFRPSQSPSRHRHFPASTGYAKHYL